MPEFVADPALLLAARDMAPPGSNDAFQIAYRAAGTNNLVSTAYTEATGWTTETIGIGLDIAPDSSPGVAIYRDQVHIVYRAAQGDLVDTCWSRDLGWQTGSVPVGPAAAGDASATGYGDALHIVYRATSGALVNTRLTEALGWEPEVIQVGLPVAADSSPDVGVFGSELHIGYRASGGQVVNTWFTPGVGWQTNLVPLGDTAAGDVSVAGFGDSFHVVYRASAGHVVDTVFTQAEGWKTGPVPIGLNIAADASPDVAAFDNELHIAYRAAQGDAVNTWWHPTEGWHSLSIPLGPTAAGDLSAVAYPYPPPPRPVVNEDCESVAAGPSIPEADSGAVTSVVGGIRVHNSLAPRLSALLSAAASDGITLGGSGYRSIERQRELRRANCGTSQFAIEEMQSKRCTPPTARPGHSMHERGVAIDFSDGGGKLRRGSPAFKWLQANAESFGLYNLPSEAWHWSVNGC